ncbi:ABC transporter ATP-binding protein [Heliobacterium mobile]|uniref:ABC transporter ATP-binding protein n=1 Tax=Heliobacterium mobile TaxID=28064 RepID=UPI001478594D|nr:ATP-binding cassette domain-containing protein [Heliobacterium mobile]
MVNIDKSVEPVLEWQNISLSIMVQTAEAQAERRLLHHVSGKVSPGEILCLLGPSGSGKSTLLTALNRLQRLSEGEIRFQGQPVEMYPVTELRRRVAYVAQRPAFFPGTVEENLGFGARLWGMTINPPLWLEKVHLDRSLLSQPADTLSGGQQQRLSLARSLAVKPDVLLLDEPTSALDIHGARELEEIVLTVVAQENIAVLWVTHDPEQARRVSHQVLLLTEGRISACLPTEVFFSDEAPAVVRTFLEIKGDGP